MEKKQKMEKKKTKKKEYEKTNVELRYTCPACHYDDTYLECTNCLCDIDDGEELYCVDSDEHFCSKECVDSYYDQDDEQEV